MERTISEASPRSELVAPLDFGGLRKGAAFSASLDDDGSLQADAEPNADWGSEAVNLSDGTQSTVREVSMRVCEHAYEQSFLVGQLQIAVTALQVLATDAKGNQSGLAADILETISPNDTKRASQTTRLPQRDGGKMVASIYLKYLRRHILCRLFLLLLLTKNLNSVLYTDYATNQCRDGCF